MHKLISSILILALFFTLGCAAHGSRHVHRVQIQPCRSFPCGARIEFNDMELTYEIQLSPSGECLLTGTAMPRGVSPDTQVELAVLSVELIRDITVADSFSFPMEGTDLSRPLRFSKRFTPNGGFDGVTFHWDIRYVR